MVNLFSVECQYLDLQRHKIFRVPRQKMKSIILGYNGNIILGTETSLHFFLMCGSNRKYPLKSDRGVNGATQSAILQCNRESGGIKLPQRGSGAELQSRTVFEKYLIEWSSFSSAAYHVKKTAQDLEQVNDVVILFYFYFNS